MGYAPAFDTPNMAGVDIQNTKEYSPIRRRILTEILPVVMPSVEGDAKFSILCPPGPLKASRAQCKALGTTFTTCGRLPGYVMEKLGLSVMANGLSGVRDFAWALGAWTTTRTLSIYDDQQMPRPGDIYLVSEPNSPAIAHIAIMINPFTDPIWSADSGQGTPDLQMALYVPKKLNPDSGVITSKPHYQYAYSFPRRIVGWADIDRLCAAAGTPEGKAAMAETAQKIARQEAERKAGKNPGAIFPEAR